MFSQDEEEKGSYSDQTTKINYFALIPDEMISTVFTFLPVKSFMIAPMVCKEWNLIFQKKSSGKIFKKLCLKIWSK
jgi:hypothetical protein